MRLLIVVTPPRRFLQSLLEVLVAQDRLEQGVDHFRDDPDPGDFLEREHALAHSLFGLCNDAWDSRARLVDVHDECAEQTVHDECRTVAQLVMANQVIDDARDCGGGLECDVARWIGFVDRCVVVRAVCARARRRHVCAVQQTQCGVVRAVQKSGPEILPALVFDMIAHLGRHMQHPVGERQVRVDEINLVLSPRLGGHRVLLR